MDQRQQNSTAASVLFFMADASDHVSGKTGLSPTVTLSKNGGAFAAAAASVSEVGAGWYALAGNASDRDTLGELIVHGEALGADPADRRLTIVPWNPFDANLGLSRLDAAVTTRADAVDYTPTRAAKLDNLDATISSRSTLTAAGVWANATRTITGTGTGAITSGSFAANAIDSAALAASAVTEIQTGLATSTSQTTIIGHVDELESRLTALRAANLDNLDATVSSRSMLTASDVWSHVSRTITGTTAGAIVSASFVANAIDSDALAASAVTEIQAGLATATGQGTIIAYVDDLESRLSATRAANLDNLDAAVSSRSTLTAGAVWSNASRTITGTSAGAIVAASFATNAIDAGALATSAVTEIQAGLATAADQSVLIAYVDELESRLSAARAANLDYLDAAVSSRLAAATYVPPDNLSIHTIEAVLSGITRLADWLRAIVRQDAGDPTALTEINAGGGTYDEAQHSLTRAASMAELLEADRYVDTSVTPWALVLTRKNTGGPGVGVELLRQRLLTETGANVTSIDTFVGRSTA